MKSNAKIKLMLLGMLTVAFVVCGNLSPAGAQDAYTTESSELNPDYYDYLVLTPGHGKTTVFKLNWGDVHTTVIDIFALVFKTDKDTGEPVSPKLSFSVAVSSAIGKGSEIVFVTGGFIGVIDQLLVGESVMNSVFFDYSYSSDTISSERKIPAIPLSSGGIAGICIAQAVLFTAVALPFGSPDFPVTMSMQCSLN